MSAGVLAQLHSSLSYAELGSLFLHFTLLSLLAVGGALATAADIHRYVVLEHGWITDPQFSASVALAQAAPGPNVLFVAVVGWNIAGPLGVLACMTAIMLPSTTLAYFATRWAHAHREAKGVRAFTQGLAPLTIGLTMATGWILAEPTAPHIPAMAAVAVATVVSFKTRISPVVLIAIGAALGAAGLI